MASIEALELGFEPSDDRLPLVFLREHRRELVLALRGARGTISRQCIDEIAAVQQTIRAIETVIAE